MKIKMANLSWPIEALALMRWADKMEKDFPVKIHLDFYKKEVTIKARE